MVRCRHGEDCCGSKRLMPRDALRAGARLGLECAYCCAALTAALLVAGVMDLLAMALVTFAISAERLHEIDPCGARGGCRHVDDRNLPRRPRDSLAPFSAVFETALAAAR